ncbi:MAG: CRISPR-associated CARF protein Csa3 [Nitrososphaeria archaeon]
MIVVVTLGFDEKFALRAVSRRGMRDEDEVVTLIPKPVDERSERVFQSFKTILEKAFHNPTVNRADIEVRDFSKGIIEIINAFSRKKNNRFLINLSGGLRALILETLLAASILKLDAIIEVEFEDSSNIVSFPLKWCHLKEIDSKSLKILEVLDKESLKLSEIVQKCGTSKTTAWRKLRILCENGVLDLVEGNYELTEFGKIIKASLSNS